MKDIYGISGKSKKFARQIACSLFNTLKPTKKLSKKFNYNAFEKVLEQSHTIGGLEVLQMLLIIQKEIKDNENIEECFDLLVGEIELMTISSVKITDKWDLKKANRIFDIPDLRNGYKYWSMKIMEEDEKRELPKKKENT